MPPPLPEAPLHGFHLVNDRHFIRFSVGRAVKGRPDVAPQAATLQPPAHALQLHLAADAVEGRHLQGVIFQAKYAGPVTRCAPLELKKIPLQQVPGALELVELRRAGIGGGAGAHRAIQNLPGQGADHREDGQRNHDLQQGEPLLTPCLFHFSSPGGMISRVMTGWLSSPSAQTRISSTRPWSADFTRCLRQVQLRPPWVSVPSSSLSGKSLCISCASASWFSATQLACRVSASP